MRQTSSVQTTKVASLLPTALPFRVSEEAKHCERQNSKRNRRTDCDISSERCVTEALSRAQVQRIDLKASYSELADILINRGLQQS